MRWRIFEHTRQSLRSGRGCRSFDSMSCYRLISTTTLGMLLGVQKL
jgi:hypothetical protein